MPRKETPVFYVYYVEDDFDIATDVKTYLEAADCSVSTFSTIAAAQSALLHTLPSIVLIDVNMPDGNGKDLCRWIRCKWSTLPIIILTVKGEAVDVIDGFQKGADDYVQKPFELAVLYSRICTLMRRCEAPQKQTLLSCDHILLDTEKMLVIMNNTQVNLSQPEYQLLFYLLEHKGKTIPRDRLLEQVWDNNGNFVNDNTLTVTMKRLREKLSMPACIKTIRSFGYRMEDTK